MGFAEPKMPSTNKIRSEKGDDKNTIEQQKLIEAKEAALIENLPEDIICLHAMTPSSWENGAESQMAAHQKKTEEKIDVALNSNTLQRMQDSEFSCSLVKKENFDKSRLRYHKGLILCGGTIKEAYPHDATTLFIPPSQQRIGRRGHQGSRYKHKSGKRLEYYSGTTRTLPLKEDNLTALTNGDPIADINPIKLHRSIQESITSCTNDNREYNEVVVSRPQFSAAYYVGDIGEEFKALKLTMGDYNLPTVLVKDGHFYNVSVDPTTQDIHLGDDITSTINDLPAYVPDDATKNFSNDFNIDLVNEQIRDEDADKYWTLRQVDKYIATLGESSSDFYGPSKDYIDLNVISNTLGKIRKKLSQKNLPMQDKRVYFDKGLLLQETILSKSKILKKAMRHQWLAECETEHERQRYFSNYKSSYNRLVTEANTELQILGRSE